MKETTHLVIIIILLACARGVCFFGGEDRVYVKDTFYGLYITIYIYKYFKATLYAVVQKSRGDVRVHLDISMQIRRILKGKE